MLHNHLFIYYFYTAIQKFGVDLFNVFILLIKEVSFASQGCVKRLNIYTEQNYKHNTPFFVFAPIFHELNSNI